MSAAWPTTWRRPPTLIQSARWRWIIYGGALVYLVLAIGTVDVNWTRIAEGWERGMRFVGGFLQPDFTSRWRDISQGLIESLTMTLTSTVVGVAISIPIGIGAARNLAPRAVYMLCRGIIAVSRALQEIIIAIFFVAMFGFGPFAGFLTLSFATIGFIAKLLAEDIEDIDEAQAEAIRATGASWWQLVAFGVQLAMYATPIIYPLSAIPEKYRWLIQLNPMTAPIETFRALFLGGPIPWSGLGLSAAITGVLLFLGVVIFNKVEKTFMDTV